MEIDPGGLIAWILLGMIAGWIAGLLTRGQGFGCIGNIAIGLVGAVIGGWLFGLLGFDGTAGFLVGLVISVIGAAVLLAIANLFVR